MNALIPLFGHRTEGKDGLQVGIGVKNTFILWDEINMKTRS